MKSHRGLSSVIGAVFLIAIVIGSLSYITYSLEVMGNFSEAIITEESRLKDKQKEAFVITSVDITGADKLDAVIKNTGQIPLKITTLYLDKQGSTDPVLKIPIDVTIAPGRSFNFLDELIDIDIDDDAAYSMKFITSRGETLTSYLHSAANQSMDITVVAIPDVVASSFSSTIIMTVVNNMTNNNSLLNLTPVEPDCDTGCTKLSGPIPAKYESLSPGDVAIFRWSFQLSGDAETAFIFTSSLVGGVPGNTSTDTVVIGDILEAQLAGQSLSAVGFGGQEGAPNAFVFHVEDNHVPGTGNYQMSLTSPDRNPGLEFLFDDTLDRLQWFSSNATQNDIHIPEGNWNASLRYSSPRLPSGMDAATSNIHDGLTPGGHTFHFNTDTTRARLDSGQISGCTDLATDAGGGGISGATWSATGGVNGSGAYKFDGNDYIRIANSGSKGDCNYIDKEDMSIAGWFNATIGGGNSQTIFSKDHDGTGGYEVSLDSGDVTFTISDKDNKTVTCKSSGKDYRDQEWHHFVGVGGPGTKDCILYVDGVEEGTDSGLTDHDHEATNPIYIGMRAGSTNGFEGYIDDILFWNNYRLSTSDIAALKAYSFGENVHKMNFIIDKTDGFGNFVSNIDTSLNYDLPWSDQFDGDVSHSWVGGNYTAFLPTETLFIATPNRINFTMSYASGEPLNLLVDESRFTGSVDIPLSTFLQVPLISPPEKLPTYLTFDNDLNQVAIFIYNAGDLGAWLTYQGTRVVFNGTGGNFAGLVFSIDDGVNPSVELNSEQDGPFIPGGSKADVDFWHPRRAPAAVDLNPPSPLRITPGFYDVTIYLNGYDESGGIIVRSIDMGNVEVVD